MIQKQYKYMHLPDISPRKKTRETPSRSVGRIGGVLLRGAQHYYTLFTETAVELGHLFTTHSVENTS